MAKKPHEFFDRKRSWSRYKDRILDFYLKPYLAKVAILGRPIAVVDCFAGAGKFGDESDGSPLLIARRLAEAQARGTEVLAVFIERNRTLHRRLKSNVANVSVPKQVWGGSFRHHVDKIVRLSETHTVFLYVDPFKPKDFHFNDLAAVYSRIRQGQSVETLINFMSRAFLRGASFALPELRENLLLEPSKEPKSEEWRAKAIETLNRVAGGDYWQRTLPKIQEQEKRVDAIAEEYATRLQSWFSWTIAYPVKESYSHKLPKYHMIFGSRSPDALELMNDAMVKARRQFLDKQFNEGMLFSNIPQVETIDMAKINECVLKASRQIGRSNWKLLRVSTLKHFPCGFKSSEVNRSIKQLIAIGAICSNASGTRIEETAAVWPRL